MPTCRVCSSPIETSPESGLCPRCESSAMTAAKTVMRGPDLGAAPAGLPRTFSAAPLSPLRFELTGELGAGGLGRVLEVHDRDIGRDVALKIVRADAPADFVERFLEEGKITGRLEHPGIVPVHDVGVIETPDGGRQCFYTMKKVQGRDLAKRLHELPLRTLVDHFHDVCQAMAYAHSKGVLHRDLKPSNVMIGEFGETLVVDWGLAKVRGQEDRRVRGAAGTEAAPELTQEGEILGTPAYMSPEQSAGEPVDERSDVWALGAILFEIIARRPAFAGRTAPEIFFKIATETPALPPEASPELAAIALKCLARDPAARYACAADLAREVRLYLEGVKQREREHAAAEEAVAKAKAAMERKARLEGEAKAAAEEAKKLAKSVKPHEDKAALWAAEDRAKELERAVVDAFGEANAALTVALGHEKEHPEGRRLKAELFWARYLEAEEGGDEKEMRLNRAIVERYNDGPFDALLKGDGTLTVRTRAYPCRCLLDGRMTKPEEMAWMGYHPFSGRELSGMKGAEGLPELEPKEPLVLKVHGPDCEPVAVEGAEVWLFRYEEIERRLFPVTPSWGEKTRPIPAAVVDGCFAATSPYRPQGPGVWLGKTPIEKHTLPMGSYLLVVAHEGRAPLRVPVSIPRCGGWEQDVTLFRPEEIPAGMIPIAAGPFGYQGDPGNPHASPAETKSVDDVFIARHPVTCREYCEFLNDLAKTRPEEAAKRIPRQAEEAGPYWPGPPYVVPTTAWLAQAPAEEKAKAKRLQNCPVDWEEEWPVFSVSWEDLIVFCAWRSERIGRPVTLPHEIPWEKSARGTDRRWFAYGQFEDSRWSNNNQSHPGGMRPVRVDEFPGDESPYGIRGLAGNSRDLCLNSPGAEYPGWRLCRGGSWSLTGIGSRASTRSGLSPRFVNWYYGGRVAAVCRFPRTPSPPSH